MAKQYIPGISGLLTEPNPADSPSNSLSEAENVVIDQSGKVQARHGLNIRNSDSNTSVPSIINYQRAANVSITGTIDISTGITFTTSNRTLIIVYSDISGIVIDFTLGYRTAAQIVSQIGSGIASLTVDNKLKLSNAGHIEIGNGTANDVLGFIAGDYQNYTSIVDTRSNSVLQASYKNNGDNFFKFIQFQNTNDEILSGYIVKQTKNQYQPKVDPLNPSGTREDYSYSNGTDDVYRYYQIDKNSGKLLNFNEMSYTSISSIVQTDKSLYLQTEDGLAECNLDTFFNPAANRFFTIKWPPFPELLTTLTQSDLYANWFTAGYKCGICYTFYRELGYTDLEDNIYESEPSKIYEITNNGKDSIINVEFDFNTKIDGSLLFDQFNEFSKLNNGRKFGIILYRTKIVQNDESIPADYFQCSTPIPFDTALTFQIGVNDILQDSKPFDVYSRVSRIKQLNVNDIISYIPNNKTIDGNLLYGGYAYSANRVQFNSSNVDVNDLLPGKLKVTAKTKVVPTYLNETYSDYDNYTSFASHTNSHSFPNNSSAKSYFGFTYKNIELSSKFLNAIETRVAFTPPLTPNANSEIGVEVWEYEYAGTTPRLLNRLSSGRNKITTAIPGSPETIRLTLDQVIEVKSNTSYLIAFYTKNLPTISLVPAESSYSIFSSSTAYNVDYFSWVENGNVRYLGTLTPRGTTDIYLRTFHLKLLRTEDLYIYDYTAINNITDSMPLTPTILNSGSILSGVINNSTPTGVEHEGTGVFETWLGSHEFFDNLRIGFSKYPNASYPVGINGTTFYYVRRTIQATIAAASNTVVLNSHGLQTGNVVDIGSNAVGITSGSYAITKINDNSFTITTSSIAGGSFWINTRVGAYDPTRFQLAITINGIPISVTYTTNTYSVTVIAIASLVTQIQDGANHSLTTGDYITIPTNLRGIIPGRYKVTVLTPTTYSISTGSTSTGTLPISSLSVNVQENSNSLYRDRYFIKNINVALETNDESLNAIGVQLYTNTNIEGSVNTNLLAPESEFITNYKDFYVHAGIQKPLTGKFSVIKQPTVETANLSHYLFSPLSSGSYALAQNEFVCNGTIPTLVTQFYSRSTPVFVESSIFNKKPVQLKGAVVGTPDTTIQTINYPNTSGSKPSDTIPITIQSNVAVTTALMQNFQFGATLFERPFLTLKLVSTDNKTDYVSIQTTPFYNRNGFYSLTAKNNILDDNYLQFLNTINESNAFKPGSNSTIIRNRFVPQMIEGNRSGQCDSDGQHKFVGVGSVAINASAANAIYYDAAKNKIFLTGFTKFDIKKFSSPGILLIQTLNDSGNRTGHALFNYTSITTDTTVANKYSFDNVNITYYENNGTIRPNSDITGTFTKMTGYTYNLWFIQATTSKNITLFLYSNPNLISAFINVGSTYSANEDYSSTEPLFTFKPHRDRDSTPVAVFEPTGNFLFRGLTQKDSSEFLDIYAWSIINEFNAEFNNKGISAYLRKAEGIGEVEVIYPDGEIIELINGEYNLSLGSSSKSGFHRFSPEINNQSFTKLAVRNNNELAANNEIRISRRGIPEITTAQSYNIVGKADKKFIGAAANVDDLYIFKEDGIFRILDQGNVNGLSNIPIVSVTQISTTSYCQAPGSIKEINNEIIYLDQSGFMSIRGGEIANISGAVQKHIRTLLSTSPKHRIKAFVNESKNLYYCTLINEVDSTLSVKSGTYIFNTLNRQWSFMNEEIIDGLEDFSSRNLVAYKQKTILANYNAYQPLPAAEGLITEVYNNALYNYKKNNFDFSYPLQTVNNYNNFYLISREFHTNNIYANAADQYDFITEKLPLGTNVVLTRFTNSFRLELSKNEYNYLLKELYSPLNNELVAVARAIKLTSTTAAIFDNAIQYFYNRNVYVVLYDNSGASEQFPVKLTNLGYSDQNGYPDNEIIYQFEFIKEIPLNFATRTIQSVQLVAGVPVKITFNPESGNQPDTNKLFQEYMVHTETNNKAMAMNFKTDSRSAFLATDRKFEYDATASNRNVFRTYIPTAMSRGRYLIRQVKHDLPLENLIITGQTIVMRDGSTRVQKDKDNS